MISDAPPFPPIPYRVILCRFNEITLKSPRYQKRLLKILRQHIVNLTQRENLTLQSILPLPGRLICFFPTAEIPQALRIFKYCIGLHSFSPAISVPRKLSAIFQACVPFLHHYLSIHSDYNIAFTSVVSFPNHPAQFLLDLKREINQYLQNHHISGNYNSHADFTLHIEIREKGTYIYVETIATHWGGYPIESKNCFLAPWYNHSYTELAALLQLRRGSIITPVFFDYNHDQYPKQADISAFISKKQYQGMQDLALYYPSALSVIIFPCRSILPLLQQNETSIPNSLLLFYLEHLILYRLLYQSRQRALSYYDNRKLHYKGLILPLILKHHPLLQLLQSERIPFFTPLVGLSSQDLNPLVKNSDSKKPIIPSSNFSMLHHLSSQFSKHSDAEQEIKSKKTINLSLDPRQWGFFHPKTPSNWSFYSQYQTEFRKINQQIPNLFSDAQLKSAFDQVFGNIFIHTIQTSILSSLNKE